MTDSSIGLIDTLTRLCSNVSIKKVTDDLPPLSLSEHSMKIWREILEFNSSLLVRCLPNPSKKVNRSQMGLDLKVWICSLNYQRGTEALTHLLGEDFIMNHVELFLINLNHDPVKSLVSHRLISKPSYILDSTLEIRLRYLDEISPRFRYLITQEHRIKSMIENYDEVTDTLCFFIYYLGRLNVSFKFPFETNRSYNRYIQYALRKKFLGGLMGSPIYRELLQNLLANHEPETLIEYHLMNSRFYDMKAFEMCQRLLPNIDDNWIREHQPVLINDIHISVLKNLHDRSLSLSDGDIGPIHEDLVMNQRVMREGNRVYLCWSNLRIDRLYINSVLMYVKTWLREGDNVYFRVKSSNIIDECGDALRALQDLYVEVHIDLDYENTRSEILYDLVINGRFLQEEIKTLIVYHKDDLFKKLMGFQTESSSGRRGPVPVSRRSRVSIPSR